MADGDPKAVDCLSSAADIAIPVIVLGEFRYGIAHSRHRKRYEAWLLELLAAVPTLQIDEETAVRYAKIRTELRRSGTPLPANDVWIASLCRQHSQPIMSRDRHFDAVAGLHRLGW